MIRHHSSRAKYQIEPDKSPIASPDGALSFLFGIFGLLMWYMCTNHHFTAATLLSVGITWIVLSIGALTASLLNMARGVSRSNVNLLAAILLGFFPGIDTLVALSAKLAGLPYQPVVYGIMYMGGSLYCFGILLMRLKQPVYMVVRTAAIAFGLLFVGLGDFIGSSFFMSLGGWNLFVFALLSFYFGLSMMYPAYGSRLPQGPSLSSLIHDQENKR